MTKLLLLLNQGNYFYSLQRWPFHIGKAAIMKLKGKSHLLIR